MGRSEEGKKGKEVKRGKRERKEEEGRRKQRNKDICDYFEPDIRPFITSQITTDDTIET